MPNTTRAGIFYPNTATGITPLETSFSLLANSVDSAFGQFGAPRVANAAARDALFPSPATGDRVFRADGGYAETYYAAGIITTPIAMSGWIREPGGPVTTTRVEDNTGGGILSGGQTVTWSTITVPFSGPASITASFFMGNINTGNYAGRIQIYDTTGAQVLADRRYHTHAKSATSWPSVTLPKVLLPAGRVLNPRAVVDSASNAFEAYDADMIASFG